MPSPICQFSYLAIISFSLFDAVPVCTMELLARKYWRCALKYAYIRGRTTFSKNFTSWPSFRNEFLRVNSCDGFSDFIRTEACNVGAQLTHYIITKCSQYQQPLIKRQNLFYPQIDF